MYAWYYCYYTERQNNKIIILCLFCSFYLAAGLCLQSISTVYICTSLFFCRSSPLASTTCVVKHNNNNNNNNNNNLRVILELLGSILSTLSSSGVLEVTTCFALTPKKIVSHVVQLLSMSHSTFRYMKAIELLLVRGIKVAYIDYLDILVHQNNNISTDPLWFSTTPCWRPCRTLLAGLSRNGPG